MLKIFYSGSPLSDEAVSFFASKQVGIVGDTPLAGVIEYEQDGSIRAACVFNCYTGSNAVATIASECPMTPGFLDAAFTTAWSTGIRRLTTYAQRSNPHSVVFTSKLGFQIEYESYELGAVGTYTVVFKMTREEYFAGALYAKFKKHNQRLAALAAFIISDSTAYGRIKLNGPAN